MNIWNPLEIIFQRLSSN